MKKNYLIEVNNLCKNYLIGNFIFPFFLSRKKLKRKKVLANINFKIKFGEKVAFLGRNGSGKSTLLKIISRVTVPTKGKVLLRGKVISMLEAGLAFHSELTARENIYMNAGLLGASKKEIKNAIPLINQFAELDEYIDVPVKKFSTGMEAKLGFSMGIFLNADLLILDELLSVVDGNFRTKCVNKINSLNIKLNKAIILVSHNMELVSKICDRGIVLDKGKIIYDSEVIGLRCRVRTGGSKVWFYEFTPTKSKSSKRYTFGSFPEVRTADARNLCKRIKHAIVNGIDPKATIVENTNARVEAAPSRRFVYPELIMINYKTIKLAQEKVEQQRKERFK